MKKIHSIVIMDGFAFTDEKNASAIEFEGYPHIKKLLENYPNTTLGASGFDVGLPDGQMGNSEVGHLNIGAGRIVYQELTRITKSIADNDFYQNQKLLSAIESAKQNNTKLHIMGLLSNGGVHSTIEHLFALIKMAKQNGLSDCYIHCFLDGRDVPPKSGADFILQLEKFCQTENFGKIASVMGRYYAMDRDNRWDRVEKAYNCMTKGNGNVATNACVAVQTSYELGVTDEFVLPTSILNDGNLNLISEKDSVIFFNFRPDRAREITRAFVDVDFTNFSRQLLDVKFVCFTQYDKTIQNVEVAFLPQSLDNTLGEYLSNKGYTQVRIAETEKYAHVTFFFNGGVEKANEGEDRVLISSPKVATYDLKPDMSAYEVCDKAIDIIKSGKYDVLILNFANCDMVGHTGIFDAAVAAVKTVDECVGKIADAILSVNGSMLLTADHGNADKMFESDGSPFTAHTTNPVPLVLVDNDYKGRELNRGKLCDIAPTLLDIMNIEKPKEMTGKSLIK